MSSEVAKGLHDVQTLRRPNPEVTTVPRSTPERALQDLGMPLEEIRAVLFADDPQLVHRHLELHAERLLEELVERRLTLAAVEGKLADAALKRSRGIDPITVGSSSTG